MRMFYVIATKSFIVVVSKAKSIEAKVLKQLMGVAPADDEKTLLKSLDKFSHHNVPKNVTSVSSSDIAGI